MSSSSISSSSSTDTDTNFPSSALAAARMRRHRRNAISRQAESEWDAPPTTTAPSPFPTGWTWTDNPTTILPPPDELICPLASPSPLFSSPFPSLVLPHVGDTSLPDQQADGGDAGGDGDDLQATLARFAFPSPTRKHRRSGESIFKHDHSTVPPPGGATRGCGTSTGTGTGPVKRARCAHCEHARPSV